MKHLISYAILRLGVGLVGVLPGSWARSLGEFGGRIWHLVAPGRRDMARRHMSRVLGPGADEKKAARDVMVSYGRYWAEALWARSDKVPELMASTEIVGLQHMIDARDAGRGMVFALPHMGNWEAAAPIASDLGIDLVAVAEKLANARITDWFTRMRAEFGIDIVLATGRAEVMRTLEDGIRAGKGVALLSDRDIKGRGVPVEFFGETTTMPPGPATLALRTGAPLIAVGCYFKNDGHRVVIGEPLDIPLDGTRSERVQALTQRVATELEKLIQVAPEQWHLVQPNWPSDRETE